jgi:hypothetical protein
MNIFEMVNNVPEFKDKSLNNIKHKYLDIVIKYKANKISKEEFLELLKNLKLEIELLDISAELQNKKTLYDFIITTITILKTIAVLK